MIKLERMMVQFNNECPRLGSGWRIVDVEIGRKWARLHCHGRVAKISKRLWEEIAAHGRQLPAKRRRRRG